MKKTECIFCGNVRFDGDPKHICTVKIVLGFIAVIGVAIIFSVIAIFKYGE